MREMDRQFFVRLTRILAITFAVSVLFPSGILGWKEYRRRVALRVLEVNTDYRYITFHGPIWLGDLLDKYCLPTPALTLRPSRLGFQSRPLTPARMAAAVAAANVLGGADAVELPADQILPGTLEHLADLTGLRELNTCSIELTDDDLAAISRVRGLESLNISGTSFTTVGLARLSELPKLTRLNADFTAIDDTWVSAIAAIPNLKELSLKRTDISASGAARLRARGVQVAWDLDP